jgi:hypothetical protein
MPGRTSEGSGTPRRRPLRRPPPRFVARLAAWALGPGAYAFGRLTRARYATFLGLRDAAERALRRGKLDKASRLARELLDLAERYRRDFDYGNALHHGHRLLGEVALRRGDVGTAREELLAAGRTPGSPQLNSFGPNMSLAKGLLEAGERDVILQYFELCGTFWKHDLMGSLPAWTADVREGRIPDFRANLVY